LHWSRYWFGTALQLSTVSYSTAIGCVWFGVLLHWSRYWFETALQLSTVGYSYMYS
jgi:hypothetical protein